MLGNKNIDDKYRYPAYPTLTNANSGVFGNNVVAALESEYIPDPNLHWETVQSCEAGFELNTLKNKLHSKPTTTTSDTKDVLDLIAGPGGYPAGPGQHRARSSNNGFEFAPTGTRI